MPSWGSGPQRLAEWPPVQAQRQIVPQQRRKILLPAVHKTRPNNLKAEESRGKCERNWERHVFYSVANPHHDDPDPDPECHFEADPEPDSDPACHFEADLEPTFHFETEPDPSFQIKAQNILKCSNRLIFHAVHFGLSSIWCGSGSWSYFWLLGLNIRSKKLDPDPVVPYRDM